MNDFAFRIVKLLFRMILTSGVNNPMRYGVIIPDIVDVPFIMAVREPAYLGAKSKAFTCKYESVFLKLNRQTEPV